MRYKISFGGAFSQRHVYTDDLDVAREVAKIIRATKKSVRVIDTHTVSGKLVG